MSFMAQLNCTWEKDPCYAHSVAGNTKCILIKWYSLNLTVMQSCADSIT